MFAWWVKNRQRILQFMGTVLAFSLLILLLREDGWDDVLVALQEIKLPDLLWVALLFLISRMAIICRWHVFLRSGGINIRFKDSASLTFTGLFASNFLNQIENVANVRFININGFCMKPIRENETEPSFNKPQA